MISCSSSLRAVGKRVLRVSAVDSWVPAHRLHSSSAYPRPPPPRDFPRKPSSTSVGDERPIRLLQPHVLTQRLTRLANEGKLDEAVYMLQNAPKDASNVVTWNTLIWHCLKAHRFKVGHKLYTDMKRRGFRPNTRTYHTMLDGLSRIDDFTKNTVQLQNAHSLYESFISHIEAVKKIDPRHESIDSAPVAFYIKILQTAGDYTKMFQVFNELDDEGPFSATEFHYAKMFSAIAERRTLSPGDSEYVPFRNASNAKLLWKQLAKAAERNPSLISSYGIVSCLKSLSRGRPADEIFAFDIIRDYCGLSKPGETAPPAKIELQSTTLDAILSLCLTVKKYRLCIHYCQQVINKPFKTGQRSIIDHGHMEKVLQAYSHMTTSGSMSESSQALDTIEWMHRQVASGWSPDQIQPRLSTYTWALMACWRGGDWSSTTRILELMSGCHAEDFLDENRGTRPRMDRRSDGRAHTPDIRAMTCVVRAALESGQVDNMRQCLRILTHFGSGDNGLWMKRYLGEGSAYRDPRVREQRSEEFYGDKMNSVLQKLLGLVLRAAEDPKDGEVVAWRSLRDEIKKVSKSSPPSHAKIPDIEREHLGSASSLAATADFVEYDMAKRMTSPRAGTRKY